MEKVTGASGFLGTTVAASVLETGGDVICLDVMDSPKSSDWGKISNTPSKHTSGHSIAS